MKYKNESNEGLMLPIKSAKVEGYLFLPVSHKLVAPGEEVELDSKDVATARKMGLKAVFGSIGETKVETKVVDTEAESELTTVLTEEKVSKWNKKDQLDFIKRLGSSEKPKLEADRVKLILELQ